MKRITGNVTDFMDNGPIDQKVFNLYRHLEDYEDLGLSCNEIQIKLLALEEFESIGLSPGEINWALSGGRLKRPIVSCERCVLWEPKLSGLPNYGRCRFFNADSRPELNTPADFFCKLGTDM